MADLEQEKIMLERANRTFICSVVFLDIVEYSKKSVAEQIKLKESFNGFISNIIKDIARNDRIILDTGDGAAIIFLGDPEDALFVALELRDNINHANTQGAKLPVRIGINLGPVRLVKDINGQPNIIGDGINVAQRVMSFAQPGQVLVSRSYYEVVSCLSEEYTKLFRYEGARTDKHVREHEVYAVESLSNAPKPQALSSRKHVPAATVLEKQPENSAKQKITSATKINPLSVIKRFIWNRKFLYGAVAALLLIGFLQSTQKDKSTDAINQAANEGSQSVPDIQKPAGERKTATAFSLIITPWGEVYLDGRKQGVSPPLKILKVRPGVHRLEIRNTSFPAYTQTLEIKPGEKLRIKHRFR